LVLMRFSKAWSAGATFAAYIGAYSFGRFFIESLRIDSAHQIAGMRINQWVSLVIVALGASLFRKFQARDRA
jgi:prolipoprotein diacylglyceryltransferase